MRKRLMGVLISGCSLFVLIGGVWGLKSQTTVRAMDLQTETEILSTYRLGDEFVVPQASIVQNGKNYEVSSTILYFPNGAAYVNETYSLNAIGEYRLEFQAIADGETLSVEKSFEVNSEAYAMGTNAVLEYKDSLDRITASSVAGLHIELPDRTSFTYNEPINIYDYDINTPLVTMHPYSDGGSKTYRESLKQIVRLTDCYDTNNYVEFILAWDYSNHITETAATYYRARVGGGQSLGITPIPSDTVISSSVYIGEQRYRIWEDVYGAMGVYNLTDAGISVYFDAKTNSFYVKDTSKKIVSDLDNSELYGDKAFKGFTTGEVYISVLAEEYFTGTVNIDISKLAGLEGKELHLSTVKDVKAPKIEIDGPDDKVYYIAKNESVTFPTATAYDVNLNGEVSVAVYSYYGTEQCRQHSYKGGVFTPKTEGKYTVVYTAEDTFGNVATKVLNVICITRDNNQIVSFSVDEPTFLTAGEICELPAYEVFSCNGDVTIDVYYQFEGTETKVEIVDNAFLVEYVGEYEIIYEYRDVFTSYVKSYKVMSRPSSNVRFDTPIFPEYLIANAPYTFEPVYAYTYDAQMPTRHNVETFIIVDGDGEKAKRIDYANTTIPTCSKVQFKYVYGDVSIFSQELPVVDVGFGKSLKMEKYFVGDFEKTAKINGVYYNSKVTEGSNELEFVNILSLSSFTFSFNIPTGADNFEAIDVVLTDYYDRSNSVTVSYVNKGSSTYMVCGNVQAAKGVAFVENAHKFYYNSAKSQFVDMSGKMLDWNNTFSSDKVLLKVVVRNIIGKAEVGLIEVGAQVLSNDSVDYFKPTLLFEDDGGVKKVGEKITIKPATVIDVLSPFVQANLSLVVMTPLRTYAVSDDGVQLTIGCATDRAYTLTLKEDGKYRITYSYTDASGNLISGGFVADVSDTEAPTIQLNDGCNETTVVKAKLNTRVKIQGYSVSDNKTAADKLIVKCMVYSPSLEHVFVTNNEFEAVRKGNYVVYYYVYDDAGNYSVTYYTVYVS